MKRIIFLIALMWLTIGTWAQHLTEQEVSGADTLLSRLPTHWDGT